MNIYAMHTSTRHAKFECNSLNIVRGIASSKVIAYDFENKNKLDKPYKRVQSQGQGHVKIAYRCRTFNAYCLLSCREHATLICLHLPTHCNLAPRSPKRA